MTFDNADGSRTTNGVVDGSLTDGRWQRAIPWLSYLSPLNDVNLRRLLGDFDNSGLVAATDFGVFGASFGLTETGNPADHDHNGLTNASDFALFGGHFGRPYRKIR